MRGCRGATLPALARRPHTSDSANKRHPARPTRSIGMLCATLNRNAQPRSKRTSPPLVGMQGSDAPRPRAMAAHLRFCKQAAPRSSQTLHRNTALYLQENAQQRSKRTSPSLEGMQGSDAPRPRATAAHLRFCKQATSSSSKANQHALPSIETSNRAAKESRCLLRGCRGATLPALARRSRTSNCK